MLKAFNWILMLAIIGGASWYGYQKYGQRQGSGQPEYLTTPVRRDNLVATIGATGTVEPEDLIDVGAQVAGRILEFGKDSQGKEIDYGSEVKEGMILAKIDDSVYKTQVATSAAALASARASLDRAKADLGQFQAKVDQSRRDWERAQKLGPSEALAKSSYDSYQSAYEVAVANLNVGKVAIKQAEAGIAQAQADLDRANQNLGYCTIKSPVDGVIIDRRVNIGQTVVASLSAPSLFLLAKDLKQVQVWVAVNEADIGNIHAGQPVSFAVDAFPNEKFQGKVGKIRLNAGMTQNVVTYTVEVVTDNSNGRLLPYLTANVLFESARRDDVLVVPNGALRWSPPATGQRPSGPNGPTGLGGAGASGASAGARGNRTARPEGKAESTDKPAARKGTLWAMENGQLRPIVVEAGLSDGFDTEVSGPEVKENMTVVTGIKVAETRAATGTTNPFVPQLRRPGGGSAGVAGNAGGGAGGAGGAGGTGGAGGGGRRM